MREQYQKYLGLLLIVLIVALLGRNYVNSQIVGPGNNAKYDINPRAAFTVTTNVSDPDGCGGTVTPSGSQGVASGADLSITVDPKGCEWTYTDDRGGSGTGGTGVQIIGICKNINATVTFHKPTSTPTPTPTPIPLPTLTPSQGVQLIQDGTVIVTPLDPNTLFPLSCQPNGAACGSNSECCSNCCTGSCSPLSACM